MNKNKSVGALNLIKISTHDFIFTHVNNQIYRVLNFPLTKTKTQEKYVKIKKKKRTFDGGTFGPRGQST